MVFYLLKGVKESLKAGDNRPDLQRDEDWY